LLRIGYQADVEKRITPPHAQRRPYEGRPLAPAQSVLLMLPAMHNARIKAEAGIIDEHVLVHFADIHTGNRPVEDYSYRTFGVERDLQVLCEMIERTERQNSQGS